MTPENEAKAAYLSGYRKNKMLEEQCRMELAQLYIDCRVPSVKQMDGMPHGSGGNGDLSAGLVKIGNRKEELQRLIETSERKWMEISSAISCVEDSEEQTVLRKIYLSDRKVTWKEVGKAIHATPRTAQRRYGQALLHFKIPEKLSEDDQNFLNL